jgi:anti-anti-sigma regulatory factor
MPPVVASFTGDGARRPDLPAIELAIDGSVAVLTLRGPLDDDAGRALVASAMQALTGDVSRLDLDLREVTDFDREGAAALVAFRQLGRALAEGVRFRTGQGAGRNALLAAHGPE